MKKFGHSYFIAAILVLGTGFVLIWILFPVSDYWKAMILLIPTLLVIFIFKEAASRRLQVVRNQIFQIIKTLESFDIDEPTRIKFKSSPFSIFNELNDYLLELIDRIRENYQANKQFTENASHELQTPLAIIKGHIELLLQSPNLREKEMESISTILQNINRLSKLNSALILLSRIEHKTFSDSENVDIARVLNQVLDNFRDLIEIQGVQVIKQISDPINIEMSATLAEILIANIIQNAIRHGAEHGPIQITTSQQTLVVSNHGQPLDVASEDLFRRFYRRSESTESLGLGLSIVKRICEVYGFSIEYNNVRDIHRISIVFIPES